MQHNHTGPQRIYEAEDIYQAAFTAGVEAGTEAALHGIPRPLRERLRDGDAGELIQFNIGHTLVLCVLARDGDGTESAADITRTWKTLRDIHARYAGHPGAVTVQLRTLPDITAIAWVNQPGGDRVYVADPRAAPRQRRAAIALLRKALRHTPPALLLAALGRCLAHSKTLLADPLLAAGAAATISTIAFTAVPGETRADTPPPAANTPIVANRTPHTASARRVPRARSPVHASAGISAQADREDRAEPAPPHRKKKTPGLLGSVLSDSMPHTSLPLRSPTLGSDQPRLRDRRPLLNQPRSTVRRLRDKLPIRLLSEGS
jgi:hypothetical protein